MDDDGNLWPDPTLYVIVWSVLGPVHTPTTGYWLTARFYGSFAGKLSKNIFEFLWQIWNGVYDIYKNLFHTKNVYSQIFDVRGMLCIMNV